jgi:hypothetical protein
MYIVVDIGCIECGVASGVVGVFSDKARAEQIAIECSRHYDFAGGGQHHFNVFEVPEPDIVNRCYSLVTQEEAPC